MFTKDCFSCSLCDLTFYSIDDYVTHMLQQENCILDLQASSYVEDLLLPRFRHEKDHSDQECRSIVSGSCSTEKKNLISKISEKVLFGDDADISSKFAFEIETGSGIRWKCRLCFLTFSRSAAYQNHFRLQHSLKKEVLEENSQPNNIALKIEPSECYISIKGKEKLLSNDANQFKFSIDNSVVKKSEAKPACHLCGQIFKTEANLVRHIGTVHSVKRPFVCENSLCKMTFNTKGSLIRHQRRHTGERPYECPNCGRKFRESGSLVRHRQSQMSCVDKSRTKIGRYGVTLPFSNVVSDSKTDCKITLKLEESLPNLMNDHFKNDKSTLTNIPTNFTEENKASVQLMIGFSEMEEMSTVRNAQECDRSFSVGHPIINDNSLKRESVSFDDQKECRKVDLLSDMKPPTQNWKCVLKCFICSKVFSKEAYLSFHMKSHLAVLDMECSTCKKKFNSDHALARHLVSHSSARQFECSICGKSFKLKSHAQSHLNSHSNEKTVQCPECGTHFKSVSSRNNHMKIHFGERNFECAVCFKKFLVKASLDRHLRIHSEERPFKCSFCHRGFREHGTLNRHLKNKQYCLHSNSLEKKEFVANDADIKTNQLNKQLEDLPETLSELNDSISDNGSELGSYLSEKVDLSSLYSDPSDISFEPEEYLLPANFSYCKPFCSDDIPSENSIENIEVFMSKKKINEM